MNTKGKQRCSVFEDGADYVILRIADDKSLHPLPDVPRFENNRAATRWLRSEEAEALSGMSLAIVRFQALASIVAEQRMTVQVKEKARFRIGKGNEQGDNGV